MNEVVKKDPQELTTNPSKLIEIAINQNADVGKLEKLMELQIRWEQEQAKKAYHAAMAEFKKEAPTIVKRKHVKFQTQKGTTDFYHADLADVVETLTPIMSKYGLSVSWKTSHDNGLVIVTCRITHIGGYSEETSLPAAPDTSGAKNPIQAVGSTISYLERYTLLALTGLAAKDMDDESVFSPTISEEQAKELEKEIQDLGIDKDKFLEYLGAESVESITDFKKAKAAIEAKRKAMLTPTQRNTILGLAKKLGWTEEEVQKHLKRLPKKEGEELIKTLRNRLKEKGDKADREREDSV